MSNDNDKHWRMVAFIVRCAQRYVVAYAKDPREPAFSRAAVADALALAEACIAACPDGAQEELVWTVDDALFDSYDVEALFRTLSSTSEAANNTYADLHDDPGAEPSARRSWAAIRLAGLALHTALRTEPGSDIEDLVQEAVSWSTDGEPGLAGVVGADLVRAMTSEVSSSEDLYEIFGDLWPGKRPDGW